MKKSPLKLIRNLLLTGSLFFSLVLPSKSAEFRVYNMSSDANAKSISVNNVYFKDNISGNGTYLPAFASPSLEIWNQGSSRYSTIKVNSGISQTYTNFLGFRGNLDSSIDNRVRFFGCNSFSNSILFTYLIQQGDSRAAGDCRKTIVESGGVKGDYLLPKLTNVVNDQIYAANLINVAPIEVIVTNFARTSGGFVKVEGKARPGTVLLPQWSTNLSNWTTMSNQAKYVEVSTNNFGTFDGFSYTNLSVTNANSRIMFFRMACDSYNSGTSNFFLGR
jgi:hypothetical protein